MRKLLAVIILISSIPFINNCAGAGGAAAGPNTALVLNPVIAGGSGLVNRSYVIVGTGSNAGSNPFARSKNKVSSQKKDISFNTVQYSFRDYRF